MAKLLLGKEVAAKLDANTREVTDSLLGRGITPTLGIIRIGHRDDDIAYEQSANKRCSRLGIDVRVFELDEKTNQNELLRLIDSLNRDPSIHGLLLFLPLPKEIDEAAIRKALSPKKDIDGITDESMAGVYAGVGLGFPPCTPEACMEILDHYDIEVAGKRAVVVGRSLVVGKPAAMMLLAKNATVTLCHSKTMHMAEICQQAEILIVAAGKAGIVGSDSFHSDQVVIDVGINIDEQGNMSGDVDTAQAESLTKAITPVPGGVGPVTISILAKHVVKAALRANELDFLDY